MIPYVILAMEDEDDRQFMTKLFVSYQRLMLSECYKVTKNPQDAEDQLQETVIKLVDKVDFLKTLDEKRLIYYIAAACRNNSINFLRKERKLDYFSIDDDSWLEGSKLPLEVPGIEEQIVLKEDIERFQKLWPTLPAKTRFLLEERYILHKTSNEIADELGMTPESVRMAISRSKRKIREQIMKETNIKE